MQSKHTEISLGDKLLLIADRLAVQNDTQGLEQLRSVLVELTLNGIVDTRTSFIDLAEYCESLSDAIQQGKDVATDESVKSLRLLIHEDLVL